MQEKLVNIFAWMIIGSTMGWLANSVMRISGDHGLLLNMVVGMLGASGGAWYLTPLLGAAPIDPNAFSIPAMLVAFLGAALLMTIVGVLRRSWR